MPRFARKELPTGFALREFPDHHWQAYRVDDPAIESPLYSRRIQAVNWCWLLIGHEAADATSAR